MNKFIMVLFSIGAVISCSKGDEKKSSDIVGTWRLIEVLADPGDGSGTFHSVTSKKTIAFQSNGVLTSNGSICDISIETGSSSSGTYSLTDSTINSPNCPNSPLTIKFYQVGSILTISYPCDEACVAKYEK